MRLSSLILAMLVAGVSCGDPSPSKYPKQEIHVEDTTLGQGDLIEIRVFYGSKEMVRSYTVGSGGTIAFPLIGDVQVDGKTQQEIEADMQGRLADGYLKNPVVSVDVKESKSRKISVLGEVKSPGTYEYVDGMTIIESISKAGGFTPMARKNAVTVTRFDGEKKVKYTIPVESIVKSQAQNFAMRPGDTVHVPERPW